MSCRDSLMLNIRPHSTVFILVDFRQQASKMFGHKKISKKGRILSYLELWDE